MMLCVILGGFRQEQEGIFKQRSVYVGHEKMVP